MLGEVDPLGNLTCANEYDVYGNIRGRMGTATTEQGFVGQLGHLSDASTGLIYMRARYMDPSTGRFVSEDPKANGSNWFTYCNNNPINETDASGNAASGVDPIDAWGNSHSVLLAVIVLIVAYFLDRQGPAIEGAISDSLLSAGVMKETLGADIYAIGTDMIANGQASLTLAGEQLTVGSIAKCASQFGDLAALGQQMQGATTGLCGASQLAAGIALQYVGTFLEYS